MKPRITVTLHGLEKYAWNIKVTCDAAGSIHEINDWNNKLTTWMAWGLLSTIVK